MNVLLEIIYADGHREVVNLWDAIKRGILFVDAGGDETCKVVNYSGDDPEVRSEYLDEGISYFGSPHRDRTTEATGG